MEIKGNRAVFRWAAIISYVVGFIYVKYMAWGGGMLDNKFWRGHYIWSIIHALR